MYLIQQTELDTFNKMIHEYEHFFLFLKQQKRNK